MLFAYERSLAFSTMLIPFLAPLPTIIVYYAHPKVKDDKIWGPLFKYFVGGFLIPGSVQWAYIFIGGLIFEALEMAAEEDANPEFALCLDANFTHTQCREWRPLPQGEAGEEPPEVTGDLAALHTALGDPLSFPWRNFDLCGSCFFCFTLITTIGYGTFAPSTAGAKIFACAYLLVGIPLVAQSFADLAETITRFFFHWDGGLLEKRYKGTLALLGSAASADANADGAVSADEVKAVIRKAGVKASDEQVESLIAATDSDGEAGLSVAEYEKLIEQLAQLSAQKLETSLTVGLFLFSLVLWSVLLPISDPANFQPEDGLYWSFITFSTVGLGDKTIALATDESAHGHFSYG